MQTDEKKYEFASVRFNGVFENKSEEHREIIERYAKLQWKMIEIDLVFEKGIE